MVSRYPVTTTKCNLCGIEFPIKPSRLKRAKLNFCSDACVRKKNTLVGWIVRCNRKFQKRCTPKKPYVPLTRNGSWGGWCNAAAAEKHKYIEKTVAQRWSERINSMVQSNKHRQLSQFVRLTRESRGNENRDSQMLDDFLGGRTQREIANDAGLKIATVKKVLCDERIRRGMRDCVNKTPLSWKTAIGRLCRVPKEKSEWTKKIEAWITNQKKRMKAKFVMAGSHQQASEQYLNGRVIAAHSPAMS